MLSDLQPHSIFLQTLDSLDGVPIDKYPPDGLLEHVQTGKIQWIPSFLRACQYYMIEPPIETAVDRNIRIYGNLEHAQLAVELWLCDSSILDWFTADKKTKVSKGVLFGVDNPHITTAMATWR